MDLCNLGVPAHLMPDTAMYVSMMPCREVSSFVAYPDTGEANVHLCQEKEFCVASKRLNNNILKNKRYYENEG